MFKYKIGDVYYSLEELSGWNAWDSTGNGKFTLDNLYNYSIENGEIKKQQIVLAKPLEDWRATTIPRYKIYSSSTQTYEPLKVLQAESVPNPNNQIVSTTGTNITIYPDESKTSLVIDWYKEYSESVTIYSKKDSSKPIIPSWVIFMLQAGGGGGGGTDSGSSRNGAGGGGGGCMFGLLKLDFNTFSKYKIQIGSGGAGGTFSSEWEGTDGGDSCLYGVKSDGTKILLAKAYGGKGGISNNDNWSGKSAAAGGSGSIENTDYIKRAEIISGGNGGQTNAIGTCSGADVTSRTIYFLDSIFAQYYSNSYFYKTTTAQTGGAAGSSNHAGGGGASASGPGGAGGGTDSDGNSPTSGYGGGGGGGRWSFWGTDHKGGDGKGGCFKLYY